MEGYRVHRYSNGDVYEGYFRAGLRHGRGTLRAANGDVYAGDWVRNEREGVGREEYACGDVYDGTWRNGIKEGRGTYSTASGEVYIGPVRDDEPYGEGAPARAHATHRRRRRRRPAPVAAAAANAAAANAAAAAAAAASAADNPPRNAAPPPRVCASFEASSQWRRLVCEPVGLYTFADGESEVSRFEAGDPVGGGVRWSADRRTAWAISDGEVVAECSLPEVSPVSVRETRPSTDDGAHALEEHTHGALHTRRRGTWLAPSYSSSSASHTA